MSAMEDRILKANVAEQERFVRCLQDAKRKMAWKNKPIINIGEVHLHRDEMDTIAATMGFVVTWMDSKHYNYYRVTWNGFQPVRVDVEAERIVSDIVASGEASIRFDNVCFPVYTAVRKLLDRHPITENFRWGTSTYDHEAMVATFKSTVR